MCWSPVLGLASFDWQMLLLRQQLFISQALWPTLQQIRGSRHPVSSALRNKCKLMQNRIRRHTFSYFVLLMKLSSLFVEWFLHIVPLFLLCSHRYWPEMCCIWLLVSAGFSNITGNQKLMYSRDYFDRDDMSMCVKCRQISDIFLHHAHPLHVCSHFSSFFWFKDSL